jgi:hypothetical protein
MARLTSTRTRWPSPRVRRLSRSFDNLAFTSRTTLMAAEDRGDTLHDQLDRLDSIWAYDVTQANPSARFVALGQDRLAGVTGEEDTEPTGLHFSDGDASVRGLIGRNVSNAREGRLFFTQQHGENNLYEVVFQRPDDTTGQ